MAINPVGTWIDPNFETAADGTSYKTALDNAARVGKRITNAFAPHAKTAPDMNVLIDAGAVLNDTTITEIGQQTIGPISAPVVNSRIDRIVIDKTTGVATRIAGSESLTPSAPALPDEKFPCAQIALAVGQTSIVNANITDERLLGGGGGATIKLKSGTNQTIAGAIETTVTAATKTLPAGLLGENNFIDWYLDAADWGLPESSTTKFRVKLGGTTLSTAEYTASSEMLEASGIGALIWVRIRNDGAANAQRASITLFPNSDVPVRTGGGNTTFGTGAVDTGVARDLTFTVEHNNSSGTIKILGQSGIKYS